MAVGAGGRFGWVSWRDGLRCLDDASRWQWEPTEADGLVRPGEAFVCNLAGSFVKCYPPACLASSMTVCQWLPPPLARRSVARQNWNLWKACMSVGR